MTKGIEQAMETALRDELRGVADKVQKEMADSLSREIDAAVARVALGVARYYSVDAFEDRVVVTVKFQPTGRG